MERLTIKGILVGMVVFLSACYYDVEEVRNPTICATDNMSYQTDIVGILFNSCYQCHSISTASSDGNNIILEGYSELIKYVESGQLLGAIKHESGYSFMPKNASSLSDCNIAKIEQWIEDGYPDN